MKFALTVLLILLLLFGVWFYSGFQTSEMKYMNIEIDGLRGNVASLQAERDALLQALEQARSELDQSRLSEQHTRDQVAMYVRLLEEAESTNAQLALENRALGERLVTSASRPDDKQRAKVAGTAVCLSNLADAQILSLLAIVLVVVDAVLVTALFIIWRHSRAGRRGQSARSAQ